MSKYMKNFITLAGVIIIGSFLAFLYNCITGLADFAGRMNPILEPWVFWILLLSVAGMLAWMVGLAFMRPKPMMVYADPSEEDMVSFRRELLKRLKKNAYLRDAEIVINDESELEHGLAYLKEKADEEIQATSKRVFIGTAISQNGRLDTLVVLFLISRLTWQVAKIYNQRPHYRELINLYANIAATSFIAGSIEEFGIEEYVAELMGPLVGGSAIGAVPGAQAISSTITTSVLTGSTNCLLALRCGIVARDYMSLNLDAKGSMRRSATLEASKLFVSMSAETVTYVTKALVKGTAGAVKSGSAKAVRGVGDTVTGAAGAVGNGAKKVGQGTRETVQNVGRGVKGAAETVGQGAKSAAQSVGEVTKGTAQAVGTGVKSTADAVGQGAKSVVHTVGETTKDTAKVVGEGVKGAAGAVGKGVKDTASTLGSKASAGATRTVDTARHLTVKTTDTAKKIGLGIGESASRITGKASKVVKSSKRHVEDRSGAVLGKVVSLKSKKKSRARSVLDKLKGIRIRK